MNKILQIIMSFFNLLFKDNKELIQPSKSIALPDFTTQVIDNNMNNEPIFDIRTCTNPISGTDFGNSILSVGPTQQREGLILVQYKNGNVPNFMRKSIPITITSGVNTLTYWVLPDVLCVGTDEDYLRTPLNPLTAKRVCTLFDCVLPTKQMANQIWNAATVKLTPNPNGPPFTEVMQNTDRMISHNAKIQASLVGKVPGELVTGHKKDVVICKHLLSDPSRVAIFGWFYLTGSPIQGLNSVSHDNLYKDYSHGIRLINRKVKLNGNFVDFYSVLNDPNYAYLISDEGAFNAMNIYDS